MTDILNTVAHRPYPLPAGHWRMRQRWSDLLFAHWPVPAGDIARLLPPGLEIDTFDGHAWIGVVPFWMDQVQTRAIGEHCITVPSTAAFCELNLRTYVRSKRHRSSRSLFLLARCRECARRHRRKDALSPALLLRQHASPDRAGRNNRLHQPPTPDQPQRSLQGTLSRTGRSCRPKRKPGLLSTFSPSATASSLIEQADSS